MNTGIGRAALAASLFAVVLASGCASLDGASLTQPPEGDALSSHPASNPLLQEMSRESQLG